EDPEDGFTCQMDGLKRRLYDIWIPDEQLIIRARDVKFDERDSAAVLSTDDDLYIAELVDPPLRKRAVALLTFLLHRCSLQLRTQ
ncbi:hypothetical protein E4U44_002419, partial [Claviceps purpurea]